MKRQTWNTGNADHFNLLGQGQVRTDKMLKRGVCDYKTSRQGTPAHHGDDLLQARAF